VSIGERICDAVTALASRVSGAPHELPSWAIALPAPYAMPPESLPPAAGVPLGTLSAVREFVSASYAGLTFRYRIYVPAQYDEESEASLLVLQDGLHVYDAHVAVSFVLDQLIHAGALPTTIAILVDPGTSDGPFRDTPAQRTVRSALYDGTDAQYAHFLLNEMLPAIVQSIYRVSADPEQWAIGGHSSGGIAAFTVAWHYPDRFRKVLTQNGSFVNLRGGDAYAGLVRSAPAKPLRVALMTSTNDLRNGAGDWQAGNRALDAALTSAGYAHRSTIGTGAHWPPTQAIADLPAALRWLWHA
jgi:enterochelin esterase family protein